MSEFKREERYIVVKIKDLKYSSVENKLRRTLYEAGIPTRECLVVESDWPEYEPVWAMIEARMTGQPDELTHLRDENEALRADAAIGRVVWRFIDRMNNVALCDPAERIVEEFVEAVMPLIDDALAAIDATRKP